MTIKRKSETTNPRTHVLGTEVYTTEQVAADLQLSQKTILRAIKSGKLRARKSGRQFLMTKEDVRTFFESLPLGSSEDVSESQSSRQFSYRKFPGGCSCRGLRT